ncbi:MAG TPA: hypothetical protein VNK52_09480 [Hyphomicrobiaceae bacterium]|nr:hypothetical protein [Hyphomicrobiaceae bacterium]
MGRVLWCWLALLTALPSAAAEPTEVMVEERARTFLVRRPAHGPHPTIIVLHRGNGTAQEELQLSGLAEAGIARGYATVFPQAVAGYWNFFPSGRENGFFTHFFRASGGVPDDLSFLRELADRLVRDGIADPRRIYLIGRSLGGAMVLRLACTDAERFAAIGLLTTAMPDVVGAECRPARPIPVIVLNATKDRVLPYKGERSGGRDILWSTERLVAFFRRLNGCGGSEQRMVARDRQAPEVVIDRWSECPGGPVVLHSIVGIGHQLPGELNTARTLLDFFDGHTR